MKKIVIVLICFLQYTFSFAQAPVCIWAEKTGGTYTTDFPNLDCVTSVTSDNSNNFYVTGYLSSPTANFGTIPVTVPKDNQEDMFLVKYNAAGKALWAITIGGKDYDLPKSVTVDKNGNVYVTGSFYSDQIIFGKDTLKLSEPYDADFFLVKYNSDGVVQWAKSAKGIGIRNHPDGGASVVVDSKGYVIVAGSFQSDSLKFDDNNVLVCNDTSKYNKGDAFIAKYNQFGTVQWVKRFGGLKTDFASKVRVDASDNIIVTGTFESATIPFDNIQLTNAGDRDIFITKLNSSGTTIWANQIGSTAYESGTMTFDKNGNTYIAGAFQSPTLTIGTTTLTKSGNVNNYFTKCDASGKFVWAKNIGSNFWGLEMDNNSAGDVIISALYSSFIVANTDTLKTKGGTDVLTFDYDSNGKLNWAKSFGGTKNEFTTMCVDKTGDIIRGGAFSSPDLDMDGIVVHNTGNTSIYIAKFGQRITDITEQENESIHAFTYPNPMQTSTTLVVDKEITNGKIALVDIVGKELRAMNFNGNTITIEKENLKPGIYFLVLTEEGKGIFNQKIIVQ